MTLDSLVTDLSDRLSVLFPQERSDGDSLDFIKDMTRKYDCPPDIMNDWAVVLYCCKCKCHNALMAEEIWKGLEKEGYGPAAANLSYLKQNRPPFPNLSGGEELEMETPGRLEESSLGNFSSSKKSYETRGMRWVRNRHKPLTRLEIGFVLTAVVILVIAILVKMLA